MKQRTYGGRFFQTIFHIAGRFPGWLVSAMVIGLLVSVLFPGASQALAPPEPGEIGELKKRGEYHKRRHFARSLGNGRFESQLVQRSKSTLRQMLLASGGEGLESHRALSPAPPSSWSGMPATGPVKTLAILIDFQDYPSSNTQSYIHERIFGTGDPSDAPYESLAAYYLRSSYGQLQLSGNTLGWYTTAYDRSDVPETRAGRETLIREVLDFYEAQGHDFTQYDNDGDGDIDYFMVIWTGPQDGWADFWWAYQTSFSDSGYKLDGKRLRTYSWQWESYDPGDPFSPRTVIHETGHALGLPDYYDYDGGVGPGGGIGGLDMMDGSRGDQNCFSKWMLGWITPTFVDSGSTTLTLDASGTSRDAVMIMPGADGDGLFEEYFMVQNRHRVGNDDTRGMKGDGLLIWHIDARLNDRGNDFLYDNSYTAHKLLRLMEADGLEEIETGNGSADAGDYYVAGKSFGPATAPASTKYNGRASNVTVTDISGADMVMSATFAVSQTTPGIVIYVDQDVAQSGDGFSWDEAFKTLQEAVAYALDGEEIWVKAGTYALSSPINVDVAVNIYGGFSGTEIRRDQRDWETHVTTLDGQDSVDHGFHITADATIDGFAITGGNADGGSSPDDQGGGIYNGASTTIAHCIFTGNSAAYGGAVYTEGNASTTISDCTFSGNSATNGGALYNDGNSIINISRSHFLANSATSFGGGVQNYADVYLTVTESTFSGNSASSGGAIYNRGGSAATITGSTFSNNEALSYGGAVYNRQSGSDIEITETVLTGNSANYGGAICNRVGSSATITNTVIAGNEASTYGGAFHSYDDATMTLTNATLYGNRATAGGAISNLGSSTAVITNTILWGDMPSELYNDATITITYSNIQGGYGGEGNMDADPKFSNPANDDFHLLQGSPCIDTGSNAASPTLTEDLEGRPRILDGDNDAVDVVDMGAYEVEIDVTVSGSPTSFSSAGGSGGGCFISAISLGGDLGL